MKPSIRYLILGFVLTFVPLAVVDYILQNAFYTGGQINNTAVADILSYQLTQFQLACFALFTVLFIGVSVFKDYKTLHRTPHAFKSNKYTISSCAGALITCLLLIAPFLHPSDYQRLLGLVILAVTVVYLRNRLVGARHRRSAK